MRDAHRPYVICHMLPSIDGRIVTRGWKLNKATREYERTAATFDAGAWIIGRISMEAVVLTVIVVAVVATHSCPLSPGQPPSPSERSLRRPMPPRQPPSSNSCDLRSGCSSSSKAKASSTTPARC